MAELAWPRLQVFRQLKFRFFLPKRRFILSSQSRSISHHVRLLSSDSMRVKARNPESIGKEKDISVVFRCYYTLYVLVCACPLRSSGNHQVPLVCVKINYCQKKGMDVSLTEKRRPV